MNKSETMCFTGHRIQKLPWGSNENDERCIAMKTKLKSYLIRDIENGYCNFWCGMAQGFDLICAKMLLSLKSTYPHIKIYGAIPFWRQAEKWREEDQKDYEKVRAQLDGIRCLSIEFEDKACYIERNCFMVDQSSKMIALFSGKLGGTKKTVEYAKKRGIKVEEIAP